MSQSTTSANVVLSVRNLTVDLPPGMERTHAVKDISFDLHAGKSSALSANPDPGNR